MISAMGQGAANTGNAADRASTTERRWAWPIGPMTRDGPGLIYTVSKIKTNFKPLAQEDGE